MYKPKGWTSFDVVKKVRGIVKDKKVGHGGTLDPFAEGVLIIGTGKHTKELTKISGSNKEYIATLKLGERTDTLDHEGKVTQIEKIPDLNAKEINSVLKSFLGKSEQIPPMFSAKKVNGKRLYKLARKNIEVERNPSSIEIVEIELNTYNTDLITFNVKCSKGTYIRVLGDEIAEKLGTVGHLIELTRVSVGEYHLDDSVQINELKV